MRKRALTLLMAVALAIGMCVPAYAGDTTYTLTLNNAQAGHTYMAYQIFAGDLHENTLSNVVWGSGVTKDGQNVLGNAAGKAKEIETAANAEAFAKEVSEYLGDPAGSVTISEGKTGTISGLKAGYYLVKTTTAPNENGVYTYYIMKVVKDTATNIKADVPSVEKVIVEGSSTAKETDVNIGDTVTFKLTATMPSTFEGYDSYKVVFHDTLSKGLTFTSDSVSVKIDETDVTNGFTVEQKDNELTIFCNNVLAESVGATADSEIVVTYTAKLNSNAEIGDPGNPNKVYLEYSNDPNWNGQDTEPTGETPEDQVIVFTYKLDATKVDGNQADTKLKDAKFVLYRVQDGTTEYAVVNNGKVSSWVSDKDKATTLVSGEGGAFEVAGLDAGTYWLEETKAPAGYNLLADPVKVVIAAELGKTQESVPTVTSLTISVGDKAAVSGNASTGIVTMTVENNKGATLPETGGMGTTLFYIVGGVLVAVAAVLLVVRRRSAGSEE